MNTLPPELGEAPAHAPHGRDLLEWSRAEIESWLFREGEKPVHAEAVWAAVHRDLAKTPEDFARVTPRVRALIERRGVTLGTPRVVREQASSDGFTRKYLLELRDGATIETVLMRFEGRMTACLSTQAGCAMGCVFCATGQAGFRRNLTSGEIIAQALHVARVLAADDERLRNIVLMGQGEPLHNYDAVMRAVEMLIDDKGLSLAGSRITLSTVGLVPGIRRLAEENRPVSLALSLHGATDEERAALVPVAKRWPLAELMQACRDYSARTKRKVFFEWTLIAGRNDSVAQARALARLLKGQRGQVNLIPLNPTEGYDGAPAHAANARAFQAALREHGIASTIRQRRGIDIAAGCGQLAGAERRT